MRLFNRVLDRVSRRSRVLAMALGAAAAVTIPAQAFAQVKTVVLVHGAFADGSGWKKVAAILTHDGYKVIVAQPPETSFEDDVAATKRILEKSGPAVLVGHSYGGAIITAAGDHEAVRALVYVAAFQPDVGESPAALNGKIPSAAKSIGPVGDGFLAIDPAAYPTDFAGDLPKDEAEFLAISQVPIATEAFTAVAKVAAWKTKPTYGVVATNDRMINPDLERFMYKRSNATTIEVPGSHLVFMSHPAEVAKLIEKAAEAAK